ncbi:MAG: glutaminyl-peptide cyclotransferase [Pseudomonadales bacterium]
MRNALFFSLLFALLSVNTPIRAAEPLSWSLVQTTARDPNHFTQGLVYADQTLFESTGRYGQSAVLPTMPPHSRNKKSTRFLPISLVKGSLF